MQERIRANARRTAGDAAAVSGLEMLPSVELNTGGASARLSGAAVPA